jgi:hypothetical protein
MLNNWKETTLGAGGFFKQKVSFDKEIKSVENRGKSTGKIE